MAFRHRTSFSFGLFSMSVCSSICSAPTAWVWYCLGVDCPWPVDGCHRVERGIRSAAGCTLWQSLDLTLKVSLAASRTRSLPSSSRQHVPLGQVVNRNRQDISIRPLIADQSHGSAHLVLSNPTPLALPTLPQSFQASSTATRPQHQKVPFSPPLSPRFLFSPCYIRCLVCMPSFLFQPWNASHPPLRTFGAGKSDLVSDARRGSDQK